MLILAAVAINLTVGDNNYEKDVDTLEGLGILQTSSNVPYWLASRYTEPYYTYSKEAGIGFYVRYVGEGSNYPIMVEGENSTSNDLEWDARWEESGIRPVFKLKGSLSIVEGDGKSEATAYKLGK